MTTTQNSSEELPTPELLGVLGSTAYGLATAASDIDRIGVYVAPINDVLSLNGAVVTEQSHVRHEPDVALHEIGKFLRLGLKANPTILELLYVTSYERCTDIGAGLVNLRSQLLSRDCVRASFGGYVAQQLSRINKRVDNAEDDEARIVRITKHARHCVRLVRSGVQLLKTGEMVLDVGDERDAIFAAGELAISDIVSFTALVNARITALNIMSSDLPAKPNREAVERFLIDTRRSLL